MNATAALAERHPRLSLSERARGRVRWAARAAGLWALVMVLGGASLSLASSFADVLGIAPLVGPGHLDSFHVSCGTTATRIASPYGQIAYEGMVDDAAGASVFFGDASVTTSTYGAAHEAGEKVSANARFEYCVVASGTITLHVRALTANDPNSLTGSLRKLLFDAGDAVAAWWE